MVEEMDQKNEMMVMLMIMMDVIMIVLLILDGFEWEEQPRLKIIVKNENNGSKINKDKNE
jgi:hypothetical protein